MLYAIFLQSLDQPLMPPNPSRRMAYAPRTSSSVSISGPPHFTRRHLTPKGFAMTARKTPRKTAAAPRKKLTSVAKAEPAKKTAAAASAPAKAKAPRRGRRPGTTGPKKPVPGCMSPDQFKDEIFRRGWKIYEVATRWGMGGNWLYKLIANQERGLRWDDAVRGLPHLATKS